MQCYGLEGGFEGDGEKLRQVVSFVTKLQEGGNTTTTTTSPETVATAEQLLSMLPYSGRKQLLAALHSEHALLQALLSNCRDVSGCIDPLKKWLFSAVLASLPRCVTLLTEVYSNFCLVIPTACWAGFFRRMLCSGVAEDVLLDAYERLPKWGRTAALKNIPSRCHAFVDVLWRKGVLPERRVRGAGSDCLAEELKDPAKVKVQLKKMCWGKHSAVYLEYLEGLLQAVDSRLARYEVYKAFEVQLKNIGSEGIFALFVLLKKYKVARFSAITEDAEKEHLKSLPNLDGVVCCHIVDAVPSQALLRKFPKKFVYLKELLKTQPNGERYFERHDAELFQTVIDDVECSPCQSSALFGMICDIFANTTKETFWTMVGRVDIPTEEQCDALFTFKPLYEKIRHYLPKFSFAQQRILLKVWTAMFTKHCPEARNVPSQLHTHNTHDVRSELALWKMWYTDANVITELIIPSCVQALSHLPQGGKGTHTLQGVSAHICWMLREGTLCGALINDFVHSARVRSAPEACYAEYVVSYTMAGILLRTCGVQEMAALGGSKEKSQHLRTAVQSHVETLLSQILHGACVFNPHSKLYTYSESATHRIDTMLLLNMPSDVLRDLVTNEVGLAIITQVVGCVSEYLKAVQLTPAQAETKYFTEESGVDVHARNAEVGVKKRRRVVAISVGVHRSLEDAMRAFLLGVLNALCQHETRTKPHHPQAIDLAASVFASYKSHFLDVPYNGTTKWNALLSGQAADPALTEFFALCKNLPRGVVRANLASTVRMVRGCVQSDFFRPSSLDEEVLLACLREGVVPAGMKKKWFAAMDTWSPELFAHLEEKLGRTADAEARGHLYNKVVSAAERSVTSLRTNASSNEVLTALHGFRDAVAFLCRKSLNERGIFRQMFLMTATAPTGVVRCSLRDTDNDDAVLTAVKDIAASITTLAVNDLGANDGVGGFEYDALWKAALGYGNSKKMEVRSVWCNMAAHIEAKCRQKHGNACDYSFYSCKYESIGLHTTPINWDTLHSSARNHQHALRRHYQSLKPSAAPSHLERAKLLITSTEYAKQLLSTEQSMSWCATHSLALTQTHIDAVFTRARRIISLVGPQWGELNELTEFIDSVAAALSANQTESYLTDLARNAVALFKKLSGFCCGHNSESRIFSLGRSICNALSRIQNRTEPSGNERLPDPPFLGIYCDFFVTTGQTAYTELTSAELYLLTKTLRAKRCVADPSGHKTKCLEEIALLSQYRAVQAKPFQQAVVKHRDDLFGRIFGESSVALGVERGRMVGGALRDYAGRRIHACLKDGRMSAKGLQGEIRLYVQTSTTSFRDAVQLLEEFGKRTTSQRRTDAVILSVVNTDYAWQLLEYLLQPQHLATSQKVTASVLRLICKAEPLKSLPTLRSLLASEHRTMLKVVLLKQIYRLLAEGSEEAVQILQNEFAQRDRTHPDAITELLRAGLKRVHPANGVPPSEAMWDLLLNACTVPDLPEESYLVFLEIQWYAKGLPLVDPVEPTIRDDGEYERLNSMLVSTPLTDPGFALPGYGEDSVDVGYDVAAKVFVEKMFVALSAITKNCVHGVVRDMASMAVPGFMYRLRKGAVEVKDLKDLMVSAVQGSSVSMGWRRYCTLVSWVAHAGLFTLHTEMRGPSFTTLQRAQGDAVRTLCNSDVAKEIVKIAGVLLQDVVDVPISQTEKRRRATAGLAAFTLSLRDYSEWTEPLILTPHRALWDLLTEDRTALQKVDPPRQRKRERATYPGEMGEREYWRGKGR